jgi:short-subunit dehydrogenase
MPIEDLEWVMGINFWGVVYGVKAFLPKLIESGDGHIVNMSSVFGLISIPSQSGYNASKFAVRGFTEALRQELLVAGHPVGVSCVHPGGVRTEIARHARTDRTNQDELARSFERIARTSPEQAARTIIDGVRHGRGQILVGVDARLLDAGQRLLGPSYQQISYRLSKLLDH